MPRNIILMSDGTGQAGGAGKESNVWRLYTDVEKSRAQIAAYDNGVGSQSAKLFRAIDGGMGIGVGHNVQELYTFLIRNWQPGDQIYMFGFSRGAYTVRLLAGMIASLGILDISLASSETDLRRRVKAAYLVFRQAFDHPVVAQHFRNDYSLDEQVPIRFIGIWDTVDAVGVPVDELRMMFDNILSNSFPDNVLSNLVEQAVHAVAIDDQRRSFLPVMWDERLEEGKERIQQQWFAGAHANVGGGYSKPQMANVALEWVMLHAVAAGLKISQNALERIRMLRDVHGQIYDSRAGMASYYRLQPRNLEAIRQEYTEDKLVLHSSALMRIQAATDGYSPFNLTLNSESAGGEALSTLDNPTWREAMKRAWGLTTMRQLFSFAQLMVTAAFIFSAVFVVYSMLGRDLVDGAIQTTWIDILLFDLLPVYGYGVMVLIIYLTQRRLKLCIRDIASDGWASVYPEKRAGRIEQPCDSTHPHEQEICEPCQAIVNLGLTISESRVLHHAGFLLEQAVVRSLAILFYPVLRMGQLFHRWRVTSTVDLELRDDPIPLAQGKRQDVILQTSIFCLNTGIHIEHGNRYQIKVENWSGWMDLNLAATPQGLVDEHEEKQLGPWKKLMRRPQSRTFCLLAEICGEVLEIGNEIIFAAESSGELKLYVNDVDLRVFQFRDTFYRNNKGIAKISIERL